MTLREQIKRIGEIKINPEYVKNAGLPELVDALAQLAFIQDWENPNTHGAYPRCLAAGIVRRAWNLLHLTPGHIGEDIEGEPEMDYYFYD